MSTSKPRFYGIPDFSVRLFSFRAAFRFGFAPNSLPDLNLSSCLRFAP